MEGIIWTASAEDSCCERLLSIPAALLLLIILPRWSIPSLAFPSLVRIQMDLDLLLIHVAGSRRGWKGGRYVGPLHREAADPRDRRASTERLRTRGVRAGRPVHEEPGLSCSAATRVLNSSRKSEELGTMSRRTTSPNSCSASHQLSSRWWKEWKRSIPQSNCGGLEVRRVLGCREEEAWSFDCRVGTFEEDPLALALAQPCPRLDSHLALFHEASSC